MGLVRREERGRVESEPLAPPRAGWLKFEMAGDTDARRFVATGRRPHPPSDRRRETVESLGTHSWRAAYVRTARATVAVVRGVADPAKWIAFNQPVEMPRISHAAWVLTKNGWLILWSSAGATVLLAGVAMVVRRREA